jgi:Cof subfamily protein (haloacid dehalogenase superfamily)
MMNLPEFGTLPRAIAIDLDGTLLNSETRLSDRSQLVLEKCIARNIPVIIATSRPARIFDRIFPAGLKQKCSYIIMNGSIARGAPPLSGYFREALPPKVLRDVIGHALSIDPGVRVTIEIDGYQFGTNWNWDPTTLWERNAATPDMVLSLDQAVYRQPCKIALGNTDVNSLAEQLARRFGDSLSIVCTKFTNALSNPIINVTSKLATKSKALRKLLIPRQISLSDVLAFGDDLPDLELLQTCGMPVAMANAFPEVKAVCKFETASNDEDGVAVVLEKMLGQKFR